MFGRNGVWVMTKRRGHHCVRNDIKDMTESALAQNWIQNKQNSSLDFVENKCISHPDQISSLIACPHSHLALVCTPSE